MFVGEKSEFSNVEHKNRFVQNAFDSPLYKDPDWVPIMSDEESDSEVGVELPPAAMREVASMYQHEEDEDARLMRMSLLG